MPIEQVSKIAGLSIDEILRFKEKLDKDLQVDEVRNSIVVQSGINGSYCEILWDLSI